MEDIEESLGINVKKPGLCNTKTFVFWLIFFHHITTNELQKHKHKNINDILQEATKAVDVTESKKIKLNEENWMVAANEVCDVIINVTEDRFLYTDQINTANLFICERFDDTTYLLSTIITHKLLRVTQFWRGRN